jgi:hypothetical protein
MLRCPHCHAALDPDLNLAGRDEPRDWDPRCCPYCAEVSTFDFLAPGGLRIPVAADWRFWTENGLIPAIERTTAAAQKARETHDAP